MGKKIILIQPVDNILGAEGLVPGLQRDLDVTMSRSNSTEGSKMGSITQAGALSQTISAGFLFKTGDAGQQELKRAMKKDLEVKIWIVDTEKNRDDLYDVEFGYVVLGELSFSHPYEGVDEITCEMSVQGELQEGTFDELPDAFDDFAQYGFELPGEYTGSHMMRTNAAPPTTP